MRVLYLNPFSQQVSGPDESLLTLLAALIPLGVEAHVALPRPGPSVARYEALGAKVHFLPLTVLKRRLGPWDLLSFPFRLARGVVAVVRLAHRERIDLVHTNMEVVLDGSIAARLLGVPHVLHYRGNTLDRPRLVFDLLTRFWVATSRQVICISEGTAAIFRRRGLTRSVSVMLNPVDLARFAEAARSAEVRRQLGAGEGDLLVGTVGRIHPRKDIVTFLRAGASVAASNPGLRLVVVGGAEAPEEQRYAAELRTLASRLGIADRLTWADARRDMPEVLKALDVFVLCSRHEGFGRVIAESLAAGRPVIATGEGAPLELLVDGQTGLLAGPGSVEEFAARLVLLAGDPAARAALATAGQTSAKRFDACSYARRMLDNYRLG